MGDDISKVFNGKLVVIIVTILSALAAYYSFTHNILVAYNDAAAHLNTARRMIDSLTPGIVQIGSVWLPLLHLLELPFVANLFLWRTGLAGSFVSGISFVVASLFLYKFVFYITNHKWGAFAAVIVFVSNVNILYLQTTAMFEPLLMATAIPAAYYLTRWMRERQLKLIVVAAFFVMLASLTRYDGWALFLSSIGIVFLASVFVRNKKGREGPLIIFFFLASFGIFLWLLYNYLIFGDPLYFAQSEYSARAQQEVLEERGQLATKNNLWLSFFTYFVAMLFNNGILIVGLFLPALIYYLMKSWRHLFYLGPLLLIVPFFFNIASLYLGQSVIWMPMVPPYFDTYFNARYGLLMLPALAFFIGYLVGGRRLFFAVVVILSLVQAYLFINPGVMTLFEEEIGVVTLQDTVSSVNDNTKNASAYLRDHHKAGELILASSASADAFIYRAGIPLKNFITEGTGYYWSNSLEDPRRHAEWVVFFNDATDRVGKVMVKNSVLQDHYEMKYRDDTYQIWYMKETQ